MRRPYSALGKIIDEIARSRDVRGPKAIAHHVIAKTGGGPTRSAWQQIIYGDSWPSAKTIALFNQAFDLDEEEQTRLALEFAFRKRSVVAA